MIVDKPIFVYVAEARCGLVKIGSSRNPQSRVETMSQHSPFPVRLIAMWPGNIKDEFAIHRQFPKQRSHNEWFRLEDDVFRFVHGVWGRGLDRVADWTECVVLPTEKKQIRRMERASASMKAAWRDPNTRQGYLSGMRNGVHPLGAFRDRHDPPLTQDDLAGLLGVSRTTVARWETNARRIDDDLVRRVSQKTGVPILKLRPDLAALMGSGAAE